MVRALRKTAGIRRLGELPKLKVQKLDFVEKDGLVFVERSKDKPFFLYLAYTIPHANNEGGLETKKKRTKNKR